MNWTEAILYAITLIGSAVSLFNFFHARRIGKVAEHATPDIQDLAQGFEEPLATGEILMPECDHAALLDRLSLILQDPHSAQGQWSTFQQGSCILVEERNGAELLFRGQKMQFASGMVRLTNASGRGTRAIYALEVPSARILRMIGMIWSLGLALPAAAIVPTLVLYLTSKAPAFRGQSLQAIQVVQVLWEPFLFAGLAKRRVNVSAIQLELFIRKAEYELRTGRQPVETRQTA